MRFIGEYIQTAELYGLEKSSDKLDTQSRQPPNLKAFGQNLTCVPRFLTSAGGGRTGTLIDDNFQMQRVTDNQLPQPHSHQHLAYTYGRYTGLKSVQPQLLPSTSTIDSSSASQFLEQRPGLYVRDFPRSKSAHVGVNRPEEQRIPVGPGEGGMFHSVDECAEENMLLLLETENGQTEEELSEPLSVHDGGKANPFLSPETANTGSNNKLVASAYREASFV